MRKVSNSECYLTVSDNDLNDLTMMNVTVCYCEIYQDKKGSEITGLEFKKAEWSLSRISIPIMEHS